MVPCEFKPIEKFSFKYIFEIVITWMECYSRKGKFFNTPGLNCSADVFFIKPIQSMIQKVRCDPKTSQDYDGPDDPGES